MALPFQHLTSFLSAAALTLAIASPAEAGCNSGSIGRTSALTSASCQASALGQEAVAVGFEADSPALGAVALGRHAFARGVISTAVGYKSGSSLAVEGANFLGAFAGTLSTPGVYSITIGSGNTDTPSPLAFGDFSIAIGSGSAATFRAAQALGLRSIAIGQLSTGGDFATALGFNTQATAFGSTALGTDAGAAGAGGTALGRLSRVTAADAVAVGFSSTAQGTNSGAFGAQSRASGLNAVAAGFSSRATGAYSIALGASSNAGVLQAMALGPGAQATQLRAVAIGHNSLADAPGVVSVGRPGVERRITNVRAAVLGTDAVNLTQVRALIAAARSEQQAQPGLPPDPKPAATLTAATRSAVQPASPPGADFGAAPAAARSAALARDDDDLEPSTIVGWANVGRDGAIIAARNVLAATRQGVGRHELRFRKAELGGCALNANPTAAGIVVVRIGAQPGHVEIEIRDRSGTLTDSGFHLMAVC